MSLAGREAALKQALDRVRATCDVAARRAADPVGFVHAYPDPQDREIVALACASVAFGNVTTIRKKLADLLARLGPSPARAADDPAALRRALRRWIHRVYRGDDVARLLAGARAVQRSAGSLGAFFAARLAAGDDLKLALAALCDAIRRAGGLGAGPARRGPSHLLPDPRAGSACKRLLLFLRWMVRPADGIDLGLWPVDPAILLCPVDTHIHKLGRNLGLLTKRHDVSWKTAEEITAALRKFDPRDPVKYDFALCHLGMLQRCPSRRDPSRCEGCGVRPVCTHWAKDVRDGADLG